ncbi:MAG: FHA domain-containing protein [Deltaproteobacteria bacterium]|nr:FHA domain-containing protein [Deltaproteobacteria bacterium]
MEAYVEVIREDGTLERVRIEGEQITVGRSPTAGVPLPDLRELEAEHLLIAPRGESCWVACNQRARVPARINGQPFMQGMVPWGTIIELPGVRIRVTDRLPKEVKEKTNSSLVLVGGAALIMLLVWMMGGSSEPGLEVHPPVEPLALFANQEQCPASGTAALKQADLFAEMALAKSERYPFDPSDGVESVRLYRRAEACYRLAGLNDAAQQMKAEGDHMQQRVEEDYAAHRLRLERALEQKNFEDALFEIQSLLALLRKEYQPEGEVGSASSQPAYVQWLLRTKRHLELLSKGKKAAL